MLLGHTIEPLRRSPGSPAYGIEPWARPKATRCSAGGVKRSYFAVYIPTLRSTRGSWVFWWSSASPARNRYYWGRATCMLGQGDDHQVSRLQVGVSWPSAMLARAGYCCWHTDKGPSTQRGCVERFSSSVSNEHFEFGKPFRPDLRCTKS
jgi:hypothetical protein